MRYLKYLDFVLVMVMSVFAAYMVSGAVSYKLAQPKPLATVNIVTQATTETLRSNLDIISKKNILAIDDEEPVISNEDSSETVASGFRGKLTGVLLSDIPEKNIAIIVTDDNLIYALNTKKEQDGMRLKSLTVDGAVILKDGKEYPLILDESRLGAAARSTSPTPTFAPSVQPVISQNTHPINEGTINVSISRVELKEELKDINKVIRGILIAPVYTDGTFGGYRVSKLTNESPLAKLGIAAGDTITRINGEDVTSPEILFNMLGKVDEITAVTIDVTRGGAKKTIFVEVE